MATTTRQATFAGPELRVRVMVTSAVFASFVVSSFIRYPLPGPNEPHYLCKARHYWDPAWCARDFFLASSDAHLVFFQTFGALTRWFSLPTTAVVGRLIGLLILAAGWTALVHAIVPGRWPPLWSAWLFLVIAAIGNLSGEWLIGGIEAKIVAYGLLFAAMACLADAIDSLRGRSVLAAGILLGAAISFHPVVGLWGAACAVFASLAVFILRRRRPEYVSPGTMFLVWLAAAVGSAAILAQPGILAGIRAAARSSAEADYIQVYYRLAHHLDPLHFAGLAWIGYGALATIWLVGRFWMARNLGERWFAWFVLGSVLIAAMGFLVGWRHGPPENTRNFLLAWLLDFELRWKLLKLYPFRLADTMLPLAAAITVIGLLRRWCEFVCRWQGIRRQTGMALIWFGCGIPALATVLGPASDARPLMSAQELDDWRDACRWVRSHTPEDALILTPTQESWAFKWYAQRAEFVNYKDCPQDGPGIIEWNNRLLFLKEWSEKNLERGYSKSEVTVLRQKGITYIVAWRRLGRFDLEPAYENSTFRIYRLEP